MKSYRVLKMLNIRIKLLLTLKTKALQVSEFRAKISAICQQSPSTKRKQADVASITRCQVCNNVVLFSLCFPPTTPLKHINKEDGKLPPGLRGIFIENYFTSTFSFRNLRTIHCDKARKDQSQGHELPHYFALLASRHVNGRFI